MKKCVLTLLLLLLSASIHLRAQAVDLDKDRPPAAPLPARWRFHAGDNPAWADPKFDDSGWSLLKSDRDWSTQGYQGYNGMGWYRFQVIVPARMDHLSLDLPLISSSYEVFADATRIGGYGKMPPHPVEFSGGTDNLIFFIPLTSGVSNAASRKVTIALRVWCAPPSIFVDGGGPVSGGGWIGESSEMEARRTSNLALDHWSSASSETLTVLQTLALVGILGLFFLRRKELEYLWFGLLIGGSATFGWLFISVTSHAWRMAPFWTAAITINIATGLVYIGFIFYLLKPRRTLLLKLAVICNLLEYPLYLQRYLLPSAMIFQPGEVVLQLLKFPWYVWIVTTLITAARRRSHSHSEWIDARLLLVPVLSRIVIEIIQGIYFIAFELHWRPDLVFVNIPLIENPFRISLEDFLSAFFLISVFAILVLRFTRTRGEQERYATEVEGARHVQQFLIPEDLPKIPGLTIESDYRPAREVGGDFFQVIPDLNDGSAMIVVGDVAGKGLEAGMLATLLVGAVRTAATFTTDPAVILSTLNNRMHGKGNATCLVLRIEADGAATLVNAGHLPPYLNGLELPMEGALPLGTIPNIEFPILNFQINPGDTLTLISDGILEAQKPDGELFGFERIIEQLRQSTSAARLATAAQDFGQSDDITVLTIARTALANP